MTVCLVTGGAGFIGSHIVEALVAQGDRVRVLDNLSSGYYKNLEAVADKIEFIEGDIQDESLIKQTVADVDFIFHLGAMVSVPQSMMEPLKAELINGAGTLKVLQAAKLAGVQRLIFSSTCAVYGDEHRPPNIETMSPRPKSPYAISKLAAENYCRLFNDAFGLETVVLRYFNIFGPRQDPSSPYSGVISIFIDYMLNARVPTIFGGGEQTRDFVYVADVVRANLLAAKTKQATGQIFNIGRGQQISINQVFKALATLFNLEVQPQYQPPRAGDIVHSWSDPTQAKMILDWSAQIDFEDGVQRLVESLYDN